MKTEAKGKTQARTKLTVCFRALSLTLNLDLAACRKTVLSSVGPQKSIPRNEAPRSKLRGITELKHSELSEIFPRLPLPLHIPFDDLPDGPAPYRGHIVPVGPKLSTTQDPLHPRLSAKHLSRREALEDLHHPGATFGCALQRR